MDQKLLHGELTQRIIGVFYQGHWELGPGFLESIYAKAMQCALEDAGLRIQREVPIAVHFRGRRIGAFRADMIVESVILLEFKAGDRLDPTSEGQVVNYLRATHLEVGLAFHFGPKASFRRFVRTNNQKVIP